MQTYPDEYLNHWADVFVTRDLSRYLTLEQFLPAPALHLARIEDGRYRPLLAVQRAVAERIDTEERAIRRASQGTVTLEDAEHLEWMVACARGIVDVPRRDGRPIEPMRHHRWHPRSSNSAFRPRAEV